MDLTTYTFVYHDFSYTDIRNYSSTDTHNGVHDPSLSWTFDDEVVVTASDIDLTVVAQPSSGADIRVDGSTLHTDMVVGGASYLVDESHVVPTCQANEPLGHHCSPLMRCVSEDGRVSYFVQNLDGSGDWIDQPERDTTFAAWLVSQGASIAAIMVRRSWHYSTTDHPNSFYGISNENLAALVGHDALDRCRCLPPGTVMAI